MLVLLNTRGNHIGLVLEMFCVLWWWSHIWLGLMLMMIAVHTLLVKVLLLLLLLFLLLLLLLLLLGLNCSVIECVNSGVSSTCDASRCCCDSLALFAGFAHFFLLLEALLMSVQWGALEANTTIIDHGIATHTVRIMLQIGHVLRWGLIVAVHGTTVKVETKVFGSLASGLNFLMHVFVELTSPWSLILLLEFLRLELRLLDSVEAHLFVWAFLVLIIWIAQAWTFRLIRVKALLSAIVWADNVALRRMANHEWAAYLDGMTPIYLGLCSFFHLLLLLTNNPLLILCIKWSHILRMPYLLIFHNSLRGVLILLLPSKVIVVWLLLHHTLL